jgi:hypothetical protein
MLTNVGDPRQWTYFRNNAFSSEILFLAKVAISSPEEEDVKVEIILKKI